MTAHESIFWKTTAKPVVVLVIICIVVGLLLGTTNAFTLPVITANREATARALYASLIPEARDFTPLACEAPGVSACMRAEDEAGYIVVAASKGYSGPVPVAIAFNADGSIRRVNVMENKETPGLGTKISEDFFITQFNARPAAPIGLEDIDTITGATISSKAALAAINEATQAYRSVAQPNTVGSGTETKKGESVS
ncbi:MAG: FMN-binding protein [Raoultibacter sp.]